MNRAVHGRQPEALREEIDHARAELGQTVHELAARMDVPSRARAAYGRASVRMRQSAVSWVVLAGGAAVGVALTVVLVMRRRRR